VTAGPDRPGRGSELGRNVGRASDCFAAEQFAEEGRLGAARIGIKLNRHIGRRGLAEINWHV
jgi:hypothetical protein